MNPLRFFVVGGVILVLTGGLQLLVRPRQAGEHRYLKRGTIWAGVGIALGVRHDVIAFVTHVEELAGEPARWLHLGMTSSDVLDASLAILLREAATEILEGLDRLREACARRADEQRATLMIGRSHGIHAE